MHRFKWKLLLFILAWIELCIPMLKNTGTFVEPVTAVQEYAANGHISIRWKRVDSCERYYIYRQEKGSAKWKWIAGVKAKLDAYYDFQTEQGKEYRYRIRSLIKDLHGNTYGASIITPWVKAFPETPVLTELTEDGVLSWAAQEGADCYAVYESQNGQDWSYVERVSGESIQLDNPVQGRYYTVRAYYRETDSFSAYAAGLQYGRKAYGKRIFFDGDSVMFGKIQDGNQSQVTYPERVGTVLGSEITNLAESGKSMAAASNKQGFNISELVEAGKMDYRGYDIICIGSGATDYNFDVPLGEEDSVDISTFYGAYNRVITEIQKQNPDAQIVLITPGYRVYRRGSGADYGMYYKNHVGYTQMDYCNAIKKIAEQKQCFVYDFCTANVINEDNILTATVDGLHPTQECYVKIGDSLAAFLREKVMKE